AVERAGAGRLLVQVEVVNVRQRLRIEDFRGAANAPPEIAGITERHARDLRELEVRIDEIDARSGARRADFRLRERIRIEARNCALVDRAAGECDLLYARAGVRIGDPDVRRAAREDAHTTAHLLAAGSVRVPVEAETRRPDDVFTRMAIGADPADHIRDQRVEGRRVVE